jgi:two-component system, OmpR family, sensor kinase
VNGLLEQLRDALEHERAFLADAAHELRTPLTALDLQVQTLLAAGSEPARASALDELRAGVARASRLVQQMLSLARHQRGSVDDAAPVALAGLVLEVVEELLPLADHRHIDLGAGRTDPASLRGDVDALRTLLRNLLDNAIRYTPEGGRVDVSLRLEPSDRHAVLEVADTGPGIAEHERPRVMDRFYRVPGTASSGSGIGLALVAAIAARHGGRVELDSGPGGAGLVVRVVLPVGV